MRELLFRLRQAKYYAQMPAIVFDPSWWNLNVMFCARARVPPVAINLGSSGWRLKVSRQNKPSRCYWCCFRSMISNSLSEFSVATRRRNDVPCEKQGEILPSARPVGARCGCHAQQAFEIKDTPARWRRQSYSLPKRSQPCDKLRDQRSKQP